MDRTKIFSITCIIIAIALFIWWPLSHWFFSDFYHQILGFAPGAYQDSMVKIIGSCGLLPIFCLIVLAMYPKNNWPLVIAISTFSFLFGLTFIYLIMTGAFPQGTSSNAATSILMSIFIPLLYRWSNIDKKGQKKR